MELIERVGLVIPPDNPDPGIAARRAENLGFSHVLLPDATSIAVLLALGSTCSIRVVVADPPESVTHTGGSEDLTALRERLPSAYVKRLRSSSVTDTLLRLQPVDLTTPTVTLKRIKDSLIRPTSTVTVELCGGDERTLVQCLALDVLTCELPGRAGARIYAEDLHVGDTFRLGDLDLSEVEILEFGERWDPLDFHINPLLAQTSPLGVLCASGLQTQAVMQRLAARGLHRNLAIVAGRGMLGMRLWQPLLPDMSLAGLTEIMDIKYRPNGRAIVTVRSTLTHEDNLVLEQTGEIIVEQRREPEHQSTLIRAHGHGRECPINGGSDLGSVSYREVSTTGNQCRRHR